MHYQNKQLLTQKLGNNTFAWDERIVKYGQSPTLTIPALIDGTIDDVKIGSEIIFEEIENEEIRSCVGLENFVWLRHCDEGNNPVDKKDVPNNFPGSLHTSR